jgi:hypothetical protein
VKPASRIAPVALGPTGWHHTVGDCEAPTAISSPPRNGGKPKQPADRSRPLSTMSWDRIVNHVPGPDMRPAFRAAESGSGGSSRRRQSRRTACGRAPEAPVLGRARLHRDEASEPSPGVVGGANESGHTADAAALITSATASGRET